MSDGKVSKRASLSALTAAALALPGIAQAEVQADYLFSHYQEADLPADRSASGQSSVRYKVDSNLFRLAAPLAGNPARLDLTYETMSGASPWWVQPNAGGTPVQVMSGASISDRRYAADAGYSFALGGIDWSPRLGYSKENDFTAWNPGLEAQFTPQGSAWTVSGGVGYSDGQVRPTGGGTTKYPTRIREASRRSLNAYGGLSLVIDAETVVQGALSFGSDSGFLSDPYKEAYIVAAANTVADSRPDGRRSVSASAKLRHYFAGPGASLHVDYRYYRDDWQIESHTLELAWDQGLGETWRVTPELRWYSQSQAFYYAPYYANYRSDGFASSDYRLSPFGALSARVDVHKLLGDWELGLGAEYYDASGHFAIHSVQVENPGLVQYWILNLHLGRRF